MHGILPLFKPKGFTSHDCVMIVRRLFKTKKVGHTGTLDPEVEGVLAICIGEATKIIPFLTDYKKEYIAVVSLGKSTTTEDSQGEMVEEVPVETPPTDEEIAEVLCGFMGEITQVPPMYSAVKVNGKKLYEYARQQIEVERPSREITIHSIERLPHTSEANDAFKIKVVCSKGTYIRTLCVDIGRQLGYPAHMSHLIRTESDSIQLAETFTFTEIEESIKMETANELLLPLERCLGHMEELRVDSLMAKKVLQGQKFPIPEEITTTDPFTVTCDGKLLAVYQIHPGNGREIKAVRGFNIHNRIGE